MKLSIRMSLNRASTLVTATVLRPSIFNSPESLPCGSWNASGLSTRYAALQRDVGAEAAQRKILRLHVDGAVIDLGIHLPQPFGVKRHIGQKTAAGLFRRRRGLAAAEQGAEIGKSELARSQFPGHGGMSPAAFTARSPLMSDSPMRPFMAVKRYCASSRFRLPRTW